MDHSQRSEKQFRSVLPHEPPSQTLKGTSEADQNGYLHVQGAFCPKQKDSEILVEHEYFEKILESSFKTLSQAVCKVELLDQTQPYTKVRISFESHETAHRALLQYRSSRLSPAQLISMISEPNEKNPAISSQMSRRPLQVTQITRNALIHPCWTRSNPPKFRRLLARPGEESAAIAMERESTRFVVITNLLESTESDDEQGVTFRWDSASTYAIAAAVRSVVSSYDSSGNGVEVFVPSLLKKRSRYCHVGMRSAADAQMLVRSLQNNVVTWSLPNKETQRSAALFVDYVCVTRRSDFRAMARDNGGKVECGEVARPVCTSTTRDVEIPGLILISDFIKEAQELCLLAVLTGPHAPWAQSQKAATRGTVRRQVQHYGYVFDYQTANVLRDVTLSGADCPPIPAIPSERQRENSNDFSLEMDKCVRDGLGWETLACLVEHTRRYNFKNHENKSLSFANLNQITVNQYLPGEGIGSHIDTPSAFSDGLISISLNGGTVMEFRKLGSDNERKLLYLPPRSLLLMTGDARYKWEHMITTRKTDTHDDQVLLRKLRVSLTLRTALAQNGKDPLPLRQSTCFPPIWGCAAIRGLSTPRCERDHVHAVYDAIATQWHHTRGKRGVLWPGATQFLQKLPVGSIVADVGCGDGKYFPAIWEAGSYVIGTDISEPLLRTAFQDDNPTNSAEACVPDNRRVRKNRQHLRDRPAVAVADCMNVPLRTSSCDAAICVAVLHHLSTLERRRRCIEELVRIVKPGGLVNVQAWALDQEEGSRRRFPANDVFVPFNAQPKYLQIEPNPVLNVETSMRNEDEDSGKSTAQVYSEALNADFDERKGLVVFKRYCHMYKKGELDEIALDVPGVSLVESGFETGNYFIIFQVSK